MCLPVGFNLLGRDARNQGSLSVRAGLHIDALWLGLRHFVGCTRFRVMAWSVSHAGTAGADLVWIQTPFETGLVINFRMLPFLKRHHLRRCERGGTKNVPPLHDLQNGSWWPFRQFSPVFVKPDFITTGHVFPMPVHGGVIGAGVPLWSPQGVGKDSVARSVPTVAAIRWRTAASAAIQTGWDRRRKRSVRPSPAHRFP